jgi:solute carrier family 25 oxoglutarate transporter 11
MTFYHFLFILFPLRMAATCFVQPLDLIKNRMQLSGTKTSTITVISSIVKNEGILAMYSGLSAGLLRQATYTTTRLGVYTWLFELAS